ncbi:MAG: OB-fold domain-containing protein [Conexivisphaerales archaeon]
MNPISYERLKDRYSELIGGRCQDCGKEYFPPPARCRACGSERIVDASMPRKGKLLSYTLLNVTSKEFKGMEPMVIGMVELENGVKVLSQIEVKRPEELRAGMSVTMDKMQLKGSFEVFRFSVDS